MHMFLLQVDLFCTDADLRFNCIYLMIKMTTYSCFFC